MAILRQQQDTKPAIVISSTPWSRIRACLPARHAILSLSDIANLRQQCFIIDESALLAKLQGIETVPEGKAIGYQFSSGFRSAVVGDQRYRFTKSQAEVVEFLYEAFQNGARELHQDELMGRIDSNQRIGQLFRDHPAYGVLIRHENQGYYWLDL